MKKIIMVLSFAVAGCASTGPKQELPSYQPKPTITQGINDVTYWAPVIKVPPRYPDGALKSGVEGCAQIGFTITPEGTVADPFVIKSFPKRTFDRSSAEAALKFKYKPSETNKNNEPVISSNIFTYSLSGGANAYERLAGKCK